jgi:hypothetical protein
MENREVPRSRARSGSSDCSRMAPSNFRVVARLRDGSLALVSLARTRWQAVTIAGQFRRAVDCRRRQSSGGNGRPRRLRGRGRGFCFDGWQPLREAQLPAFNVAAVLVQTWEGRWQRLDPDQGGYFHSFPLRDTSESRSTLRTGAIVRCHLLQRRTRRGGWRARLAEERLEGPVTNWAEIPTSAHAGQAVELRIGTISADRRRIQFHWVASQGGPIRPAS